MINLLPPEEKEELIEEKKRKSITILGMLFLVFLICFSLILYSINIFISGAIEAQRILFDQREKEFKNPQAQALQENLINFNQTLSQIDSFYQSQLNLTEILEKTSKALPPNSYLTSLSLSPELIEEERMNCNLLGFSPTREILLEFKENLEKEKLFTDIYFPPTNWVQSKDINFTVNFKVR